MKVGDELAMRARFAGRYGAAAVPAVLAIDQRVIGGWGASGYTTVDQTEALSRALSISPGDRLLDIGSGLGWPGRYLAVRTGCRVVLTDTALEGLRAASDRAAVEGIANRSAAVAAAADVLPLRTGSIADRRPGRSRRVATA